MAQKNAMLVQGVIKRAPYMGSVKKNASSVNSALVRVAIYAIIQRMVRHTALENDGTYRTYAESHNITL